MSRWSRRGRRLLDVCRNLLPGGAELVYVVEDEGWVIAHHGRILVDRFTAVRARLSTTAYGVRRRAVHFGSVNTFSATPGRWPRLRGTGTVIVTWFHQVEDDPRLAFIPAMSEDVDLWHTSCELSRRALVAHGAPADRIAVVPLGVDTRLYVPATAEVRRQVRSDLGIAEGRFVVGSFQKDGVGWGDGEAPKLIKGPDILCDALERVALELPVTVLLTGPARGYVKRRLTAAGIPYVHRLVPRPEDLAPLYHALDLYVVSSRVEGGPLGLLEAMASGVAVASTPVGMAPEVIADTDSGLIAAPAALAGAIQRAFADVDLRTRIAARGPAAVAALDWAILARRYEHELYRPLGVGTARS